MKITLRRRYLVLFALSILFIAFGSIILLLNINMLMDISDRDQSFSKLQHIQGEMKFFKVSSEDFWREDDDEAVFSVGEEDEAFFIIHLWNSDDNFLYDKDWSSYDRAKTTLQKKSLLAGVIIDIWFNQGLDSRTFLQISWFKSIRQLVVDGEMLISYDDVLEDKKEGVWNGISQGAAFSILGVSLFLIISLRRLDLKLL